MLQREMKDELRAERIHHGHRLRKLGLVGLGACHWRHHWLDGAWPVRTKNLKQIHEKELIHVIRTLVVAVAGLLHRLHDRLPAALAVRA